MHCSFSSRLSFFLELFLPPNDKNVLFSAICKPMIFGGKKKKNTAISDCVERSGIYPFIITKRLRYALLPVTVTLTLHTDVITQEGTEDEVLLGRELVQRTGNHKPYGIQALASAEEEVDIVALQR